MPCINTFRARNAKTLPSFKSYYIFDFRIGSWLVVLLMQRVVSILHSAHEILSTTIYFLAHDLFGEDLDHP